MSSRESGGESPPPETQTGAQLHDAPASGHGVNDPKNKEQTNKADIESLTSNPKGPMDDALEEKFSKSFKPS